VVASPLAVVLAGWPGAAGRAGRSGRSHVEVSAVTCPPGMCSWTIPWAVSGATPCGAAGHQPLEDRRIHNGT
jgi:hypothetical protein